MPCSFTWVCQFECCFVLHILSALCYYILICCPISQLVSLHFDLQEEILGEAHVPVYNIQRRINERPVEARCKKSVCEQKKVCFKRRVVVCLSVCLLVGCPYPKCLCSLNCWWIHHTDDDVVFVGFWRQVVCTR
jgi:hypothetical protein